MFIICYDVVAVACMTRVNTVDDVDCVVDIVNVTFWRYWLRWLSFVDVADAGFDVDFIECVVDGVGVGLHVVAVAAVRGFVAINRNNTTTETPTT